MKKQKEQKIEEIIRNARIIFERDKNDKKVWIYPADFNLLLNNGAKPIKENDLEGDNHYTQEILYGGMIFQTATSEKINYKNFGRK